MNSQAPDIATYIYARIYARTFTAAVIPNVPARLPYRGHNVVYNYKILEAKRGFPSAYEPTQDNIQLNALYC